MKFEGRARPQAELTIKHFKKDENGKYVLAKRKRRGLLGLLGFMKPDVQIAHGAVTDAFVALLVDAMIPNGGAQLALLDDFKYHDSGTGVGAEAAADVGLGTPCGDARDIGTQVEGATANIYKSIATHTYAGSFAITEHGLFNAAAGVTLLDRTKFAAVNVDNTEKIEFTYQLTLSSGG